MAGLRPVSVSIHTWMVTYDIANDRRRQLVAKALAGYGARVQYSVFECRLDARELRQLRQRIAAIADAESDRIRWYPLCRPCHGRVIQDEGFYLV